VERELDSPVYLQLGIRVLGHMLFLENGDYIKRSNMHMDYGIILTKCGGGGNRTTLSAVYQSGWSKRKYTIFLL